VKGKFAKVLVNEEEDITRWFRLCDLKPTTDKYVFVVWAKGGHDMSSCVDDTCETFIFVNAAGKVATKGNCAYVFADGLPLRGEGILCNLANEVKSATILETGHKLDVRRENRRVILSGYPEEAPAHLPFVIKLELDGPARAQFYY